MTAAGRPKDSVTTGYVQPRQLLPCAVVVLAAGVSTRFGGVKLLAPLRGRPLVRLAVESVLAARPADVVVVLGHRAAQVGAALAKLPVRFVTNPRYELGMGTSIAAGVGALQAGIRAVMIALGDQPLPSPEVPRRLAEAHLAGAGPIVAPVYAGVRGNPVLFDAALFPDLVDLHGDEGARGLIASSPELVSTVEFPFPPPPDVDTPADLARLR